MVNNDNKTAISNLFSYLGEAANSKGFSNLLRATGSALSNAAANNTGQMVGNHFVPGAIMPNIIGEVDAINKYDAAKKLQEQLLQDKEADRKAEREFRDSQIKKEDQRYDDAVKKADEVSELERAKQQGLANLTLDNYEGIVSKFNNIGDSEFSVGSKTGIVGKLLDKDSVAYKNYLQSIKGLAADVMNSTPGAKTDKDFTIALETIADKTASKQANADALKKILRKSAYYANIDNSRVEKLLSGINSATAGTTVKKTYVE